MSNEGYCPATLSVDPGGSTGWVFINTTGEVEARGTILADSGVAVDKLRIKLKAIAQKYQPSIVVIEQLPLNITRHLREIVNAVDDALPDRALVARPETVHYTHYYIRPTEWKPVTGKVPVPFSPSTQHEKDSFRMAYYWLRKNGFVHAA